VGVSSHRAAWGGGSEGTGTAKPAVGDVSHGAAWGEGGCERTQPSRRQRSSGATEVKTWAMGGKEADHDAAVARRVVVSSRGERDKQRTACGCAAGA